MDQAPLLTNWNNAGFAGAPSPLPRFGMSPHQSPPKWHSGATTNANPFAHHRQGADNVFPAFGGPQIDDNIECIEFGDLDPNVRKQSRTRTRVKAQKPARPDSQSCL